MHVPELIALTMFDWHDQPWDFYRDLSCHLWDEARHAMLGEVAFTVRNLPWWDVPHDVSFAEYPNTQLSPQERYTLLWGIEQSLMKKTGKRAEYENSCASHDKLSMMFHDFDWADEVLHAQIGRTWLKHAFPSEQALKQASELAWQRILDIVRADASLPRSDWWDDFYASTQQSLP